MSESRFRKKSGDFPETPWRRLRRRKGLLACVVTACLCCFAQPATEAQAPATQKISQDNRPDNQSAETRELQGEDERPVANLSAQQKKIAADKARLLKLATELKNEIDKVGTGTLSVTAIRKANEIEKLARAVRQEMNRDLNQTP